MKALYWVLGALLAGVLIGHLLSTPSETRIRQWQAETDSLLTVERDRHDAKVAALKAVADSAFRARDKAILRANTAEAHASDAEAEADAYYAEADSLHGELAHAETAWDSLDLYDAENQQLRATVNAERRASDSLKVANGALRVALRSAAKLDSTRRSVIAEKDARIGSLERQLDTAPIGERLTLHLWGMDIRPGGAVIYGTDQAIHVGVGLTVTP